MLEELKAKKIPIEQMLVNPKKIMSLHKKLEGFCAQSLEVKQWAQRSFICYLRSVHLQSNKSIFDVHQLPLEEFAASLGLPRAPRVRFLQKASRKHSRVVVGEGEGLPGGDTSGSEEMEGDEVEEPSDEDENGKVLFVKR